MRVYLSIEAAEQLQQLLDYLEANWSIKVRDNFIAKLDRSMKIIENRPFAFPSSEKFPGLRKCVLTRQTLIFYRIFENEVEIISLVDARQNE